MICWSPAFCKMVAGIGAGHFGYFSLNFGLFGDFQSIIDFYAQVVHCRFQFGVTKQQLDGPQVLGPTIDQGCFGPAHRVGAIGRGIEADRTDPSAHDASVLPG
jgi:hypothetical protein